jgi:hypothetical protein
MKHYETDAEYWDVWVGSQTPEEFRDLCLEDGQDVEEEVDRYVSSMARQWRITLTANDHETVSAALLRYIEAAD